MPGAQGVALRRHAPWVVMAMGALLTAMTVDQLAHGKTQLAGLVLLAALTWAALVTPQALIGLVVVLVASVLPPRWGPLSFGGVRSDLAELLAFLAIGAVAVRWVVLRERLPRFAGPLLALVATACAGAVVGMLRRAERGEIIGDLKAWSFYLLPVAMLALLSRTRADRDALERRLTGFVGAVTAFVLVGTALRVQFPEGAPGPVVVTGQLTYSALRLRPAVLPLVALVLMLLLRRALRDGLTPRTGALIAALAVLQVLSFNRSTWVPLALAAGLFLVLRPRPRMPLRTLAQLLVATALVASVSSAASLGLLGGTAAAAMARAQSAATGEAFSERSYHYRVQENRAAREALRGHEVTGIGLGVDYGLVRARATSDGGTDRTQQEYIHNGFLRTWLSTGVAGLLALLALALAVVRAALGAVRTDRTDEAEGGRALAAALFLGSLALSGLFQTTMLSRPAIVAVGFALCFLVTNEDRNAEAQP